MTGIPFNPAEIAISIDIEVEKEVLAVYQKFIRTVVPLTPKKSGLAQGNWRTSLGRPPIGTIKRTSGAAAVAAGIRSVKAARKRLSKGKGGRIYIGNNLPYIGLLNAGSSDQAAAFFVEVAFAAAQKPGTRRRKQI